MFCGVLQQPLIIIYLARAGSDFIGVSSVATFTLGSLNGTTRCVAVDILDDDDLEGYERFRVVLTSEDPAVVLRRILTIITIMDSDGNIIVIMTMAIVVFVLSSWIVVPPKYDACSRRRWDSSCLCHAVRHG